MSWPENQAHIRQCKKDNTQVFNLKTNFVQLVDILARAKRKHDFSQIPVRGSSKYKTLNVVGLSIKFTLFMHFKSLDHTSPPLKS